MWAINLSKVQRLAAWPLSWVAQSFGRGETYAPGQDDQSYVLKTVFDDNTMIRNARPSHAGLPFCDTISTAAVDAPCGESRERAHIGPFDFVLRALAARKLLQQSEFLRRCAAEKPVIHTHCSGCKAEEGGQKWRFYGSVKRPPDGPVSFRIACSRRRAAGLSEPPARSGRQTLGRFWRVHWPKASDTPSPSMLRPIRR